MLLYNAGDLSGLLSQEAVYSEATKVELYDKNNQGMQLEVIGWPEIGGIETSVVF
jgi:hypothetical protein